MAASPAPARITNLLRNVRGGGLPQPPRPDGRLVWLHLPAAFPPDAISALQGALEDTHVLFTSTGPLPEGDLFQPLPVLRKAQLDQFLQHWQPDLLLWGAPENGLPVVRRAKKAGIKMLLADLSAQGLSLSLRGRLLAEFLLSFEQIFTEKVADAARLEKLDIQAERVVACKPLSQIAAPPAENEAMLRRVSAALGPRPVWCAVAVSRGEIGALLVAHRYAQRAFPNLLLVVLPRAACDVIAARITEDGWRLGPASGVHMPDKQDEVLLAEDMADFGTWMQLAAVSYMGGSLYGPEAADPFPAVSVGSAILCGPFFTPYESRYVPLSQAGALSLADTNGVLPAKLVAALAPDAAAQLAMKAWNVGSDGADAVLTLARGISAALEKGAS